MNHFLSACVWRFRSFSFAHGVFFSFSGRVNNVAFSTFKPTSLGHFSTSNFTEASFTFAAKEICKKMSTSSRSDWGKIKRLAQYLFQSPRLDIVFPFENLPAHIIVYPDSDWAGDRETRRSINTWSTNVWTIGDTCVHEATLSFVEI